jgi:hypothetical protein
MNWLLLGLLAVSASPAPLDDGTLLFLENCNSVVELSTRGKIGHVALAFTDDEGAWIYEATPAKVRRVTIDEYFQELARLNARRDDDDLVRVWALKPQGNYADEQIDRMRGFLDDQLGRRYSIRNYVRREPGDGIHCAELTAATLTRSGRYYFDEGHKLHPSALYAALLPAHQPPEEIAVPSLDVRESWSVRAQRRWTDWCTWCGWSCQEVWSFCW